MHFLFDELVVEEPACDGEDREADGDDQEDLAGEGFGLFDGLLDVGLADRRRRLFVPVADRVQSTLRVEVAAVFFTVYGQRGPIVHLVAVD